MGRHHDCKSGHARAVATQEALVRPDGLTLLPRKGQPFEKRSTRNEPKVEVYRDNQIDVKGDI